MILFLHIICLLLYQPKETRGDTDKLYGDRVCTTTGTGVEENCCICYPGSSSCPSVCPSGLYFLATTYSSCNFVNNNVTIEPTTSSPPGPVTSPANETTLTTLIEASPTENSTDDNSTTVTTPTTTISTTTPIQHVLIRSSICVKKCPDGFFGNVSSVCVACDDVCVTCNGSGSKDCETQDDDSLPAIVGGVVGGTVVLIVVIVVVACVICKKRRGKEQPSVAMLDIPRIEDATVVDDQDNTHHVTDHSPVYGNMPEKPKDFSFQVLAKQDEFYRYTEDPTAKMDNGEAKVEENMYGNQMAIQLHNVDRETRATRKRIETNESAELTALGQPPSPPTEGQCDYRGDNVFSGEPSEIYANSYPQGDQLEPTDIYENSPHESVAVNEPEDIYENTPDVQTNEGRTSTGSQLYQCPPNNAKLYGGQTNAEDEQENTNTETQLEPSEDYENCATLKISANNTEETTESAQNEFVTDSSPSELYDNMCVEATNVGFVDDNDAPVYGNVEDMRRSMPGATYDPIYGNVDSA